MLRKKSIVGYQGKNTVLHLHLSPTSPSVRPPLSFLGISFPQLWNEDGFSIRSPKFLPALNTFACIRIIANVWKYEEWEKKELEMAVRCEEWVGHAIHRNERGKGGK